MSKEIDAGDGRHVWVDSLINGQPSMLLGYPVEIEDNMPDVGAGCVATLRLCLRVWTPMPARHESCEMVSGSRGGQSGNPTPRYV